MRTSLPTIALICASLAVLTVPTYAAEHEVRIEGLSYIPAQLTIQAGDRVTWRNISGTHNVVADGGAFSSGNVQSGNWTFSHTFNQAGAFPYFCSLHGAAGGLGMAGAVTVQGGPPPFAIQAGLSGAWFNPATGGQGWFIDVSPAANNLFFAAWFTWTAGGGYDWYTAQGSYSGNRARVPLIRTTGGLFNNPAPVVIAAAGEADFTFTSCTQGQLTFRIDASGLTGTIPLVRLTPPPANCQNVPANEPTEPLE